MAVKYKLLKAIDISGLSFLSPVVRLVTGEEPAKQVREIGRFIVVPVVAFLVFLWLWSVLAPKHKTKAGEVPTPTVVWDAAGGIWRFHERESAKESAYQLTGPDREEKLTAVRARLGELDALEAGAKEQLDAAEASSKERFDAIVAPSKAAYEQAQAVARQSRRDRTAALREKAKAAASSPDERSALLREMRAADATAEVEKAKVDALNDAYAEAQEVAFPQVKSARNALTRLAEERQFLVKYIDMLSDNSREAKVAVAKQKLDEATAAYDTAAPDADLYKLGGAVLKRQELLATTEASQYAKPWTLPKQIVRSLLCVFTGFLLASVIAIPIGILCGLSPTFMAATTPFVALFKPVSPLVWLPIIMIIVGGFMPDPENHWLVVAFGKVPFIKDYKIDPMFLSSAITVALCSLWATLVNTALGVASVDKDHMNVARVLRLGFADRLLKIVIPTALPLIFAGLRISLGVGWMVLVAAEILSTSEGIGKFVNDMYTNGSSQSFAQMFVVVFIVGIIGMLLDRIMVVFQRLVSFDTAQAAI
ncbi:MAG: ABC transporter permease subunit [Verrucomicrobiae bacterium]|nr:ABC transporter permease subunit [Verrucomicrobiae bacterium]